MPVQFDHGNRRGEPTIVTTGPALLRVAAFPDNGGRLQLTCAKDRHGHFRRGDHVADLPFKPGDGGRLDVKVFTPNTPTLTESQVPALLVAREVVAILAKYGAPMTQRAVLGMIKTKAITDTKRAETDLAVAHGAVSESTESATAVSSNTSKNYLQSCSIEAVRLPVD
jgi:hypothetical protein